MKYFLEGLILIIFLSLVYLIYSGNKTQENAQIEALNNRFDSLQIVSDSVTIIEKSVTKKITIINNYYDSTKTIIYNLPDSAQFSLLLSNIERYQYLLNLKTSQNY